MADYSSTVWVDDDGSGTTGTLATAARMNKLEAGVKDAAEDSKDTGLLAARPAASAATKNWIYTATDGGTRTAYYCDGATWILLGKPQKDQVAVATMSNVNIASSPATIDGYNLVAGDRVLLANQTTGSEEGVRVFTATGAALARAPEWSTDEDCKVGMKVVVRNGTIWGFSTFHLYSASAVTSQFWKVDSPIQVGLRANRPAMVSALQSGWGYYSSDTGELAIADGTATLKTVAPVLVTTSLPSGPVDGQECYFLADATNGVVWHLRYRSASSSAYKWEFLGGASLWSEVTADESVAAATTSYTTLTTAGPTVTLPLAGDYDVSIGYKGFDWGTAQSLFMSYAIGGTGAVDADSAQSESGSTAEGYSGMRTRRKTGMTAATALAARYKHSSALAVGNFTRRWMSATPVRVG